MDILITNGRIIDVKNGIDMIGDLYVKDGRIIKLGEHITPCKAPDEIIDAKGMVVMPGMVDIHVHLRDPGFTHKEDIKSGTAAAAMGGFTSVACMPNTNPVTDSAEVISYIKERAKEVGYAHVYPIAAITKGQKGEEMTDLEELYKAGAAAFSDDGRPVIKTSHMADAMARAAKLGVPVISHCEDLDLAKGVMNEGEVSRRLGVDGIPNLCEDLMIAREVTIAEELDVPVHIAHVSTASGAEIIRNAKIRGVKVTCETCPHYFSLTDEEVANLGTNAKVNPPLRTSEDVKRIADAVADGTIDVIATDHAPHHADEKAKGLTAAPSGLVGLETALAVSLTYLYRVGKMPLADIISKLTAAPADVLGIEAGTLGIGKPADITVVDIDEKWTVDANKFASRGRNTPYDGMTLYGKVKYTICAGRITVKNGELAD